jgi:tetratricopeptide (TPR) repeat protein
MRALSIYEQLGVDHPSTAVSLSNLALCYTKIGRYGEAEPLYVRALDILFSKLGQDHPSFQTGFGNFIEFLKQAIAAERTAELSDHHTTQNVLAQLQQKRVKLD